MRHYSPDGSEVGAPVVQGSPAQLCDGGVVKQQGGGVVTLQGGGEKMQQENYTAVACHHAAVWWLPSNGRVTKLSHRAAALNRAERAAQISSKL